MQDFGMEMMPEEPVEQGPNPLLIGGIALGALIVIIIIIVVIVKHVRKKKSEIVDDEDN